MHNVTPSARSTASRSSRQDCTNFVRSRLPRYHIHDPHFERKLVTFLLSKPTVRESFVTSTFQERLAVQVLDRDWRLFCRLGPMDAQHIPLRRREKEIVLKVKEIKEKPADTTTTKTLLKYVKTSVDDRQPAPCFEWPMKTSVDFNQQEQIHQLSKLAQHHSVLQPFLDYSTGKGWFRCHSCQTTLTDLDKIKEHCESEHHLSRSHPPLHSDFLLPMAGGPLLAVSRKITTFALIPSKRPETAEQAQFLAERLFHAHLRMRGLDWSEDWFSSQARVTCRDWQPHQITLEAKCLLCDEKENGQDAFRMTCHCWEESEFWYVTGQPGLAHWQTDHHLARMNNWRHSEHATSLTSTLQFFSLSQTILTPDQILLYWYTRLGAIRVRDCPIALQPHLHYRLKLKCIPGVTGLRTVEMTCRLCHVSLQILRYGLQPITLGNVMRCCKLATLGHVATSTHLKRLIEASH